MSSRLRDRRAVLRLSGVALATVSTAGCLGGQASTAKTVTMGEGFAFEPETVTIETGQTVKWTNTSDVGHTVTAYGDEIPDGAEYFASGGFDSERAARNDINEGMMASGDEYEHTFEQSGTYEYYCIPHESSGMVGTVQVKSP